ncbi:glutaredoxin [Sulfodiicoccus acidiphilus]|uniref:Glutaredoxin n=1 Tax=Sulfodiicoccus acidiphilus TaxID=1670455 RepID=A0A348B2T1_9CREN|nr:thioredoxin family protein [Sulfodiicoccus acidiphilus]BBD72483.1 glutaredoxin [Sulfodiicoccus acidiphilus]GGT96803.1 glutaredoxin [Sulfodiicoccus acidiphilus]
MEEYVELFNDEVKEALKDALKDMKEEVDVYVFTSNDADCQYCDLTVKLMKFIGEATPRPNGKGLLKVHVFNQGQDDDVFRKFMVERVPTVAFLDGIVRWTGAPIGEELRALVETIVRLSVGDSGLSPEVAKTVRESVKGKVRIETIVTHACPYCPYAALMGHMVAYEAFKAGRSNVVSDAIEAYENQDVAEKYQVMSVPTMAINGSVEFIGVPTEENLINSILEKQKAT